jgi:hypothetical protein
MSTTYPPRGVVAAEPQDFNHTVVAPAEDARTVLLHRVSWGAVIAGVALALVTQVLLNMLGVGIGVAVLDPYGTDNPSPGEFSMAAGIWYVVSGIIASGIGGFIAGRLSGRPVRAVGGLHGLTAWAATTLVMVYLLSSAVGGMVSTAASAVGNLGQGAAQGAMSAMQTAAPMLGQQNDPFDAIGDRVREASGGNDPAALRDAAVSAVRAALTADPAQANDARDRAAQALARAQNIPAEQAREQVAQYERDYRQTLEQVRQQATAAAEATARLVSRGALFGFAALVLGALAAWLMGRAGAVRPMVTDPRY